MHPARPMIEHLASQHEEHLRWLRRRLRDRLPPDEVEDVLQAAYAKALVALGHGGASAPSFETDEQARAWLRTIAGNLAADLDRRDHGRRPSERASRPQRVGLDDCDGFFRLADRCVDVEADVLDTVERQGRQAVIARALDRLKPEYRQILKLRYGDCLDPAQIMLLEGMTPRQWDGRHTRAVKAFGRALARSSGGGECEQTRRLLRRDPVALLGQAPAARQHVDGCLSCRAFARSVEGALAAMPLPVAIAAWRFEILDYFPVARRSATHSGAEPPQPAVAGRTWHAVHGKLAAACAGLALAVAAAGDFGTTGSPTADPRRASAGPALAPPAAPRQAMRWASHAPARRAVEAAARRAARERARARAAR